jgi:hypothetical protein
MPGFGGFLNDEEIAAVINYVRQSFDNDLTFLSPQAVGRVRAKTESRRDFYMVEELMREHPIPGWETWAKGTGTLEGFE